MAIRKAVVTAFRSTLRKADPAPYILSFGKGGGVPDVSMNSLINMHVIVNVTEVVAAGKIRPAIVGFDPITGEEYPILNDIEIIKTVGSVVYRIGKDIDPVPGLAAIDMIPPNVKIKVGHINVDPVAYGVTVIGEFLTSQ